MTKRAMFKFRILGLLKFSVGTDSVRWVSLNLIFIPPILIFLLASSLSYVISGLGPKHINIPAHVAKLSTGLAFSLYLVTFLGMYTGPHCTLRGMILGKVLCKP